MSALTDKMGNRFLGWRLPEDFAPDCGIAFSRQSAYVHPEYGPTIYKPTGTNLFTADQAKAMFLEVAGPVIKNLEDELARYKAEPPEDTVANQLAIQRDPGAAIATMQQQKVRIDSLTTEKADLTERLASCETENAKLKSRLVALQGGSKSLECPPEQRQGILAEIGAERIRQYLKWGGTSNDDKYTPLDWYSMIADYNAWARRMACMGSVDKARNRYIQVATLAVAAVEAIDRNKVCP